MNQNTTLSLGLLALRLGFGSLMLTHGIPKLMAYSTLSSQFPDPIGVGSQLSLLLAIGAEVGCSLLLILGLFTRLATLPLIITMLVAALIVHGADPLAKKEAALTFLISYVTLLLTGPGRYALDAWVEKLLPRGRKSEHLSD